VERSGVQFLFRRDGDLALVHYDWCLAAQRDSVIADDVDAHGWVLLVDPAATAAGEPTHALFADQSHSIPDNLMALLSRSRAWHCSPETSRSAAGSAAISRRCASTVRRLTRLWSPTMILKPMTSRRIRRRFTTWRRSYRRVGGSTELLHSTRW